MLDGGETAMDAGRFDPERLAAPASRVAAKWTF
jgi:hypothetical protein